MNKATQNIALMGHIVAGFPNFAQSLDSAVGIAIGGAEYLEVQFPFLIQTQMESLLQMRVK